MCWTGSERTCRSWPNVRCHAVSNQVVSGVRVFSKIVPAITQSRRHPHDAFSAAEQMPLEPAGDMTAVSGGKTAVPVQLARPGEQLLVPAAIACHCDLPEAPSRQRVNGNRGVGLHMRVDADYGHVRPLPPDESLPIVGIVGGHALAGASMPGSYQVTPATLASGGGGQYSWSSALRATDSL